MRSYSEQGWGFKNLKKNIFELHLYFFGFKAISADIRRKVLIL
jgi:hypothetical protein